MKLSTWVVLLGLHIGAVSAETCRSIAFRLGTDPTTLALAKGIYDSFYDEYGVPQEKRLVIDALEANIPDKFKHFVSVTGQGSIEVAGGFRTVEGPVLPLEQAHSMQIPERADPNTLSVEIGRLFIAGRLALNERDAVRVKIEVELTDYLTNLEKQNPGKTIVVYANVHRKARVRHFNRWGFYTSAPLPGEWYVLKASSTAVLKALNRQPNP